MQWIEGVTSSELGKCGDIDDAVIKLRNCSNTIGEDFTIMAEVRNSIGKILLKLTQSEFGVFNHTNDQLQLGKC